MDDVFVSGMLKRHGSVVGDLAERLGEGERVLAAVSVCKIHPALDILVVTNRRVLSGWRDHLTDLEEEWPVELSIEDVADIAVTGFMDNLKLLRANGRATKVGNLRDAGEEKPLRRALERARGRDVHPEQVTPTAGPTTYEVYRPPGSTGSGSV